MITKIELEIEKLKQNDDFYTEELLLSGNQCILLGYRTLIDVNKTKLSLYKITLNFSKGEPIKDWIKYLGNLNTDLNKITESILNGKAILIIKDEDTFVEIDPVSLTLNRSINEPKNESTVESPLDAFIEDLPANIGLLRKRIKSQSLHHISFKMGEQGKNEIALFYLEGSADHQMVTHVSNQLKLNSEKAISDLQDLYKVLGIKKSYVFPMLYSAELSFQAADYLKKGRIILFIDGQPVAIVLPVYFWDMILAPGDKNYPVPISILIRFVRVLGIFITLILPALYVALVAVNPEVLKIELALSVAQSREGVPYPALIEMLIMSILIELIMEASVRLPRSIGPAITMVGGIILGTAIVEAKLVSNLLIIIIAATTISNSTVFGFQNTLSLRVFKYFLIILASIYGVFGIMCGLAFTSAYLAGLNTFGSPYLYFGLKKAE